MPNTSKHQIRFEKLDSTFLSIFVFFSQFSFQIGLHVAQEYEKKKISITTKLSAGVFFVQCEITFQRNTLFCSSFYLK